MKSLFIFLILLISMPAFSAKPELSLQNQEAEFVANFIKEYNNKIGKFERKVDDVIATFTPGHLPIDYKILYVPNIVVRRKEPRNGIVPTDFLKYISGYKPRFYNAYVCDSSGVLCRISSNYNVRGIYVEWMNVKMPSYYFDDFKEINKFNPDYVFMLHGLSPFYFLIKNNRLYVFIAWYWPPGTAKEPRLQNIFLTFDEFIKKYDDLFYYSACKDYFNRRGWHSLHKYGYDCGF